MGRKISLGEQRCALLVFIVSVILFFLIKITLCLHMSIENSHAE